MPTYSKCEVGFLARSCSTCQTVVAIGDEGDDGKGKEGSIDKIPSHEK